jgi:2Fe-2S ferredoxin
MPQISFKKPRPPLEVRTGANLMRALLDGGLPVASSCGGEGICGKCRIQILSGGENLTRPTPLESKRAEKDMLASDERISCQTRIRGDIRVDTTYW